MALMKIKLGDYIIQIDKKNTDLTLGLDDVMGMTITKEIIPTKADINPDELPKFWVVEPYDFVYNPRTHGKKIGLGFNNSNRKFLISWNNIAFRVNPNKIHELDPMYLFVFFNRNEWDREAAFRSWGSSTEVFSWDELCSMELELPSIDIQRKYVEIYKGMIENQTAYETGLEDLKITFTSLSERLKRDYPLQSFMEYVVERSEINKDLQYSDLVGVGNSGFIVPRGSRDSTTFHKCNIFYPKDFVYNPSVIMKGAIAYNNVFDTPMICTEEYIVFHVSNEEVLLPEYLFIWLRREETGRYLEFYNMDSVRNRVYFKDLDVIKIPIPPIETQRYIADIFNAYTMRKEINEQLKQQIKTICPVLIKGAVEEAKRS